MTEKVEKGRLGATFDSFLEEQGIAEETREIAVKRVIAWQLAKIMEERKITKAEMARRLSTSRAQLDRLLDPDNDSVTLGMLTRAAKAVGRTIKLELA
ncbi:Fis family transcriptional regulator [Oleomonas cavernae]|uniref:Fis family transcriptional regulator n=1 Tax=Oleomonas cavernae TaxID=2320859 RepID=A0A418WBL0_9PROT|nr:helix-turn-helix transcriptional regulator [Oleomonas cavernae]RJF87336.1 Fis family transcriptional regulator [Oleomonas cavernae]